MDVDWGLTSVGKVVDCLKFYSQCLRPQTRANDELVIVGAFVLFVEICFTNCELIYNMNLAGLICLWQD